MFPLVTQLEAPEAKDSVCYSHSPLQNTEPHGHSLLVRDRRSQTPKPRPKYTDQQGGAAAGPIPRDRSGLNFTVKD